MVGRVECLHQARHVVGRVAVGNVAADGADVADLRVGNLQRSLANDRRGSGKRVAADQLVLGGHGADGHGAAIDGNALHRLHTRQIDEMADVCDPLLHHRDQAVAAGDDTGVIAPFGEKPDGSVDAVRPVICERTWNHACSSLGLFLVAVSRGGQHCFREIHFRILSG